MRLFKCRYCGTLVFFENDHCESCGHQLGFVPSLSRISALEPDGGIWRALEIDGDERFRFCANAQYGACNWLIPTGSGESYCLACRHNLVIPDMSFPENLPNWQKLERAKHRLFYSLLRLELPLVNRADDPEHGLGFAFLAVAPDTPKVMTGHDNGLITVALTEADDAERERTRHQMGEVYRTLLGHFRHEVGHYYWDVLVRDAGKLDACRAIFGDDSQDYGEALTRHYAQGAPFDWQQNFVSPYASSHPWEDFAESWAHYLHIVDTLETGAAFGLQIEPVITNDETLETVLDFDPYRGGRIGRLMDAWLPLVFAVNSLNRSMGQPDLYPFVLTPGVVRKLGFIHDLVHSARTGSSS
jgi:hypothetical protein